MKPVERLQRLSVDGELHIAYPHHSAQLHATDDRIVADLPDARAAWALFKAVAPRGYRSRLLRRFSTLLRELGLVFELHIRGRCVLSCGVDSTMPLRLFGVPFTQLFFWPLLSGLRRS